VAEATAAALLLRYPKLVAIFGTDGYSGAGAGEAVEHSAQKGKVMVVTYDAEPFEISAVSTGLINGLIAQRPVQEGEMAMADVVAVLRHQAIPHWPGTTLADGVQYVPVAVVTRANMNSPSISQYFYKYFTIPAAV
jgi:ribose transport system substrate-binding protein